METCVKIGFAKISLAAKKGRGRGNTPFHDKFESNMRHLKMSVLF